MTRSFEELYSELIKHVELEDIQLINLNCRKYNVEELKRSITIEIRTKNEVESFTEQQLLINVSFKVIGHEADKDENRLFEIDFTFTLKYSLLENNEKFNEEVIDLFVKNNVPLNVWPYARELISSITVRMGLPALVIGTYKILPQ